MKMIMIGDQTRVLKDTNMALSRHWHWHRPGIRLQRLRKPFWPIMKSMIFS